MEPISVNTSGFPLSILSLFAAASALLIVAAHRYLSFDLDPREPPVIKPRIPYIGHVLGIIMHGTKYFEIVK